MDFLKKLLTFLLIIILAYFLYQQQCTLFGKRYDYSQTRLEFYHNNGLENKVIERVETGESISVGFTGLEAGAPVEVFLTDEQGKEWSYARLFADKEGVIKPTLFWYHTGVIGKTSRHIDFIPDLSFETFEEAERYFQANELRLTVKDLEGNEITTSKLSFSPAKKPMIYPSDKEGILYNAFNLEQEDMYVTGKNFPEGATVHILLVPNQHFWNEGDSLMDVSGKNQSAEIETIKLGNNESSFTVKIQDKQFARPGSYDIITRIDNNSGDLGLRKMNNPEDLKLRNTDIISYGEDTGVLYYLIVNGHIVFESTGRIKNDPAIFEFSDAFEKGEEVYAAAEPNNVPLVHSGGNYAGYYVVEHQPATYWDGASPILTDVTSGIEIMRVKYGAISLPRTLVWANATQTDPMKDYDLVVDFGLTPAMNSVDFIADNTYNIGTDFIDDYNNEGFWVYEDPSSLGPFSVGFVDLDEPNGISGITDPKGMEGPKYSVKQAWARIMYPADTPGEGVTVSTVNTNYPIALFMHGRHYNCDYDGAGAGLSGRYAHPDTNPCPVADRIPSHEGYDYIMERLASQGIFCISISTHDIQFDDGIWNYFARGKLVLKFLDKLRDWNNNGTDPFGGIFNDKLDMSKIALSGHSRGGEGVVIAQDLNLTWPNPHGIVAVNAIAPTDQDQNFRYNMSDAPYFLLLGARDGDVTNLQGFKTYDRSYKFIGAGNKDKSVAWVYGANHNYFNTIWTETAELGSPNPWAGSKDDGSIFINAYPILTAAEQRQVALSTICGFFRRHLQGIAPYKEIFTGRVKLNALQNNEMYWNYQDKDRLVVDNFEQIPLDKNQNSLLGSVTTSGFSTFEEQLLNNGITDYTGTFVSSKDNSFFHDALGLKLVGSGGNAAYISSLPIGSRDISSWNYLTFRAAKKVTGIPFIFGTAVNLLVNLEDGNGNSARWDLRTDQFDAIPHPFYRTHQYYNYLNNQAQMMGVRIPLKNFTLNNSGVDLTDIRKIIIKSTGNEEIGIDDIEFSK